MAEEEVRARCPRCGTIVRWEGNPYRPFCSQRCRLIDLGKWVDEEYRIVSEKTIDEEKEEGRGIIIWAYFSIPSLDWIPFVK